METKDGNPKMGLLKSGKLCDYTGHVFDRKRNYWGYIKWLEPTIDGDGDNYIGPNAILVSFDDHATFPYIVDGAYTNAAKEASRQALLEELRKKGLRPYQKILTNK